MSRLSFNPAATMAAAIRTMQNAQNRLAVFGINNNSDELTRANSQSSSNNSNEPPTLAADDQTEGPAKSESESESVDHIIVLQDREGKSQHSTPSDKVISRSVDIGASAYHTASASTSSSASVSATASSVVHQSRKRKHSTDESLTDVNEQVDQTIEPISSSACEVDMDTSDDAKVDHSPQSQPQTESQSMPPHDAQPASASIPCLHYVSKGPAALSSFSYVRPESTLPSYSSLSSSGGLARVYPFTLDEFQQRSIEVLESHQHLLVSAHTSAGKTVVAEYAIAMVFRENARRLAEFESRRDSGTSSGVEVSLPPQLLKCIYTAPIKSLSNQKYREFKEIFNASHEDVGLLTGDVILNPNATCLIMTTEILRNMLYHGNETVRACSIVIFDEVHYMKDTERGIIWEESIIMLDPHVQCVFLSATLSNAEEFAEWIHDIKAPAPATPAAEALAHNDKGDSKEEYRIYSEDDSRSESYQRATCHVVYTNTRPIPLVHYLFLNGGQGLYQIKNDRLRSQTDVPNRSLPLPHDNGSLITANFRKIQSEIESQSKIKAAEKSAISDLLRQQSAAGNSNSSTSHQLHAALASHRATKRSEKPDLIRLITLAIEQEWLPLLVFSFSRRECEHLSLIAADKRWNIDLTSADEKHMIDMVWSRAMEGLNPNDRELPQLRYLLPLVRRGIAVHHSGLLPILKELIEILFQESLIKCLFCTETFAMGVNTPSRTVVFTSLQKFDGRAQRYLHASEYIQMAGRAGRRGIDHKGIVVMMVTGKDIEAKNSEEDRNNDSNEDSGTGTGGMIRSILTGSTDPLQSKFRLTYNMILNLIQCSSTFEATYILAHSFLHFQQKTFGRFRRNTAGNTGKEKTTQLTSVSAKRARMGEGGIASLAAAGSDLLNRSAAVRVSVGELRQQLQDIEKQILLIGLDPTEQEHIRRFDANYHRYCVLFDYQYAYATAHPLECMLPFLQSGRLVFVQEPPIAETNTTATMDGQRAIAAQSWGWGVIVHWRKRYSSAGEEAQVSDYVVDVLLAVDGRVTGSGESDGHVQVEQNIKQWGDVYLPKPWRELHHHDIGYEHGDWQRSHEARSRSNEASLSLSHPPYHIVSVSLAMLHTISAVRIYLPPSLLLDSAPLAPAAQLTRQALFGVINKAMNNFPHKKLPSIRTTDYCTQTLNPSPANGIPLSLSSADDATSFDHRLMELEQSLAASPVLSYIPANVDAFQRLEKQRASLHDSITSYSSTLSRTYLTSYRIELQTRLRILRRFQHLSSEGLITSKGRIAAEIECSDELLLTEFIFEGHWTGLSVEELIAMLTAFLEIERSSADKLAIPTGPLKEAFAALQRLTINISQVSNECGLILDTRKYTESFKHDLIPIAYTWLTDPEVTFAKLLSMSNLFEGSLVRLFRRLDELLNQLIKAAKNIGEAKLEDMLLQGQAKLKKGIMFAGSLYI